MKIRKHTNFPISKQGVVPISSDNQGSAIRNRRQLMSST